MATVSYSDARAQLAKLWDEIEESREEVILERRGHEDLPLLPARELQSLRETAHLLRSPRNAVRLLQALARSRGEGGRRVLIDRRTGGGRSDAGQIDRLKSSEWRGKALDPRFRGG